MDQAAAGLARAAGHRVHCSLPPKCALISSFLNTLTDVKKLLFASYAHGAGAEPLLGETIGQNLRRTVQRFGDRPALIVPHQQYRATYREFWDEVAVAARALLARGVKRGDRVGIWAPNRYEWVVVQFATARIGAILVNINPSYQAGELAYALAQSGVSFLFSSPRFRQTDYLALIEKVRAECPELRQVVVLGRDWDSFLEQAANVTDAMIADCEATLSFDDPINIQYTSGTTGRPKGATLSHHNILNNAYFLGHTLRYTEADRVCIPVPFYHCFGMVAGTLCCAAYGACMVIPGESFHPRAVLETVQQERCTSLYGVPTMFIAELEVPDFDRFDLSTLRTGIMAGAPCPAELMKRVQEKMHLGQITIACGMTETSPVATQTCTDDSFEKRINTVGRPHPHVEIKIIDPLSGAVVPRGTPGEQCMRGYNIMLGYWNDDAATRNAIDDSGWMHSGDLAVMDEEGYVQIVGRLKDMIIRGGENVYPREIEECLHLLPVVSQAQVIGIPSAKHGEEIMAWVRLRDGAVATERELAAHCRNHLAHYKTPRYWKFVDSFPLTVTGKVQKFRMREIAITELGLDHSNTSRCKGAVTSEIPAKKE
jgi:fatty-acyl-CoA synthase